ncbi:hypothetical protein ACI3K4_10755 [Streptomyces sp. CSMPJR101]|uniref:hypothetical protein n=1 Tax=Streptomyces sp. CSMPJR101 TaxID=1279378 RepID=UPI003852E3BE
MGQAATESVPLVMSELVTNAIEHALPPVVLRLHRDRAGDQVWVGVTDVADPASTRTLGTTTPCTAPPP